MDLLLTNIHVVRVNHYQSARNCRKKVIHNRASFHENDSAQRYEFHNLLPADSFFEYYLSTIHSVTNISILLY